VVELRVANVLDDLMDLESPIREVRYMASIAQILIQDHSIENRRADGTFLLSDDEISCVLFVATRLAEMALKLDEQFHRALTPPKTS
jgi:hypothetical protein